MKNNFVLTSVDANATGIHSEHGFTVKAGSLVRKDTAPSTAQSTIQLRGKLIAEGILVEHDIKYRFAADYLFNSPSAAASAVLGRSANGWVEWEHADGRSLSEVKRVTRIATEAMLSDSKRIEIVNKCEELLKEGRISTSTQVNQYYKTFHERFGPEILKGLDGEALLNLIHDLSNRDSLVYWLEYKNDEEFNTKRFGSIAGGSALKFRIFRRKELSRQR